MSDKIIVTTTTVIAPSSFWQAEIASELVREGFKPELAEMRARHVLHRVCGHAGYRSAFLVGDEESGESPE